MKITLSFILFWHFGDMQICWKKIDKMPKNKRWCLNWEDTNYYVHVWQCNKWCRLCKIPVVPTAVAFNKPKHDHFLFPISYFKALIMLPKNGCSGRERGGGLFAMKWNGYDDSYFPLLWFPSHFVFSVKN